MDLLLQDKLAFKLFVDGNIIGEEEVIAQVN